MEKNSAIMSKKPLKMSKKKVVFRESVQENIDVKENSLRGRGEILDILLRDNTRTNSRKIHNILWATDSYKNLGFRATDEILREDITGKNGNLIQSRAAKSREEQISRTKSKAEVFTPLKIVKEMNLEVARNLNLPENHDWTDFVRAKWLEITCGEAPFITSRYNPVANSRKIIEPQNRVGFLDEKLKLVSKNCDDEKEWLKWAEIALKNCYGYEWSGDNLLIARENVLSSVDDFYKDKFAKNLTTKQLEHFAEIVAWNIFQMDGMNMTAPMSYARKGHFYFAKTQNVAKGGKKSKTVAVAENLSIFSSLGLKNESFREPTVDANGKRVAKNEKIVDWATGIPVKIMDWERGNPVKFAEIQA